MIYITTVNNQTYRVDISENGQLSHITLDGSSYSLAWQKIAPLATDAQGNVPLGGRYSLLLAGKSYELFARRITKPGQKGRETYEIQVAGQRFEVLVEDERSKLLAGLARSGTPTGAAMVAAPMPGLVVGISVEVGASVHEGQTVVILEAMKMENDLPSPVTGTVKEICITRGQTVDQGEVLVVIG
ncbi:MAG: hypothetical protein E6J34_11190 [Chloroflexi bacterium]|nr:MAG: hypothetical protein E6J34_11190 [Chloroflexota bacterium]